MGTEVFNAIKEMPPSLLPVPFAPLPNMGDLPEG